MTIVSCRNIGATLCDFFDVISLAGGDDTNTTGGRYCYPS